MRLAYLALAAMLAIPGGANAATLVVSLTGTVTKKIDDGQDPPSIQIGDQVTLRATIDTSLIRPYGSDGMTIASFYDTGTFSVDLADYSWISRDEIMDGDDFSGIVAPALLFRDKKVVGLVGHLLPASGATPDLAFYGLNDLFRVGNYKWYYNNIYNGPAFEGRWNFGISSAAVPEPSTWAMLLLGFGAIGHAARRRVNSRAADRVAP